MDQGLKEYILAEAHELNGEDRKSAAEILKRNPEGLKKEIRRRLEEFGGYYAMQSGRSVLIDFKRDTEELMNAYREIFQDELSATD